MPRNEMRLELHRLLEGADVILGGSRPADPIIHDERFYGRVLADGSLGLGESYMEGWWDCERIDQLVAKLKRAGIERSATFDPSPLAVLRAKLVNMQSETHAFEIGRLHYDLGNDLFEAMLDRRMMYSCANWRDAQNLDTAQLHKLEWIARKLELAPGQRLLDIGCGFGGAARFFAEEYGVEVVGITVSREQQHVAEEVCHDLPVRILLCDYRKLDEPFDRIVSIGMFEHVGHRNYDDYFDVVRRCLEPDGLFLLQTIGSSSKQHASDPWLERHIFPSAMLPTAELIARSSCGRLIFEDWENSGADYDRTLMAWHRNFEDAWPRLSANYGEDFRRMWRYYLLSCAGAFRARAVQLWQIVFSPNGVPGGYRAPQRESLDQGLLTGTNA